MAITKKTFYGSGEIFSADYTEGTTVIPDKADGLLEFAKGIATADNQIGYLKGGYQFELQTDKFEDQSDLGEMKISEITKENATVKFGLFNANAETISKQYPTATFETGEKGSAAYVGGLNHIDTKMHVVVFKKKDNANGDTYCVCVGKNTSGFNLSWQQDSAQPFSCEYECIPFNDKGNFYVIADEKKSE